jgi:excisionase family DNA binding protein
MAKYVLLDEAATKTGVSARTLYRWIKNERLKRYKGGIGDHRVYVDLDELKRLQKLQRA